MNVDLAFNLTTGSVIPVDHGYALYGALSRVLPEVHRENGIAVHPVWGRQVGNRQLMLLPWSTLTLRVPDGQIAPMLALSGKPFTLGETTLRVGVPEVRALVPASTLRSRLVVIKIKGTSAADLDADNFAAAARRKLDRLGLSPQVEILIPPHKTGPLEGQPLRRTLNIKGAEVVGYEVILQGLTAEESVKVQEQGLGGRHHMGCGVFVPAERRKEVAE